MLHSLAYLFQCYHHYRNAVILLHSLAERADDDRDKQVLRKCKTLPFKTVKIMLVFFIIILLFLFSDSKGVENRLMALHKQRRKELSGLDQSPQSGSFVASP